MKGQHFFFIILNYSYFNGNLAATLKEKQASSSKHDFSPKLKASSPLGLNRGLPMVCEEPHLVRPLGSRETPTDAVTEQTEAVEGANINRMKRKKMTKHLLQEKYGGGGEQGSQCQEQISEKNTFFQNDSCCSASLKLNITKRSSETTILISQVVPHAVFFLPEIDHFLITPFSDSTPNVRSSPSFSFLTAPSNSQHFQDAKINYSVVYATHSKEP